MVQGSVQATSHQPHRTTEEIKEIVKMVRFNLYNKDFFCGDQAILWELEDVQVQPIPSLRTINRILNRHSLTPRRTVRYEPKGKPYPELPALMSKQTHQIDPFGLEAPVGITHGLSKRLAILSPQVRHWGDLILFSYS